MAQTTAPAPSEHHEHDPYDTATGTTNTKLAMWIFLSSECLFFGAFIATYLLYRGRSVKGPLPSDVYNIPFTSVTSFILLMSSLTMVLALAAIQRGDHRRFRVWMIATALFGLTFIAGQIYEFTEFYREGLALSTNVFGSSFFVLTGLHGAHVTVGLILLGIANVRAFRGHYGPEAKDHLGVEVPGIYWHFVDVMWIIVFTAVYIL
jgi:heme/copper-type cytochrome/quinol oxidase subunit 3